MPEKCLHCRKPFAPGVQGVSPSVEDPQLCVECWVVAYKPYLPPRPTPVPGPAVILNEPDKEWICTKGHYVKAPYPPTMDVTVHTSAGDERWEDICVICFGEMLAEMCGKVGRVIAGGSDVG